MILYRCDLCGDIRECAQKEIEQTEYDVCADCWSALQMKLNGKGRHKKHREAVTLPLPMMPEPQREKRQTLPGQPPEIIAESGPLN
jgi:ribosome-binding protein aMBF1 (putative translation factor)